LPHGKLHTLYPHHLRFSRSKRREWSACICLFFRKHVGQLKLLQTCNLQIRNESVSNKQVNLDVSDCERTIYCWKWPQFCRGHWSHHWRTSRCFIVFLVKVPDFIFERILLLGSRAGIRQENSK